MSVAPQKSAYSQTKNVIEDSIRAASDAAAYNNNYILDEVELAIIRQDLFANDNNNTRVDEAETYKILATFLNVPLNRLEDFRRGVLEVAQRLQPNEEPSATALASSEEQQTRASEQDSDAATGGILDFVAASEGESPPFWADLNLEETENNEIISLPESNNTDYTPRLYPERETISGGIWNYVYDNMDLSDDDKELLARIEHRLKNAGGDPQRAPELMAFLEAGLALVARGEHLAAPQIASKITSPDENSLLHPVASLYGLSTDVVKKTLRAKAAKVIVQREPQSAQSDEVTEEPQQPVLDVTPLPILPEGLSWPTLKYKEYNEIGSRKHGAIIRFLKKEEWQRIFKSEFIVTRQILKSVDFDAWSALVGYLKYRDLPDDIPVVTDNELSRRAAQGK